MKDNDSERTSSVFRLWHWGNALVVGLLLLTVFLRKTFFHSKKMAALMGETLVQSGVSVPEEPLRGAARAVRDTLWEWHYPLGFVLGGLLLVRIFFARQSFPGFGAWKARIHSSFYFACAFMATSGSAMYFADKLGLSDDSVDFLQELHETALWYFVAFLLIHLGGVLRAELGTEPGVVSRMIHGKRFPARDAPGRNHIH